MLIKKYNTRIGLLAVHEKYVISEPKSYIDIDKPEADMLKNVVNRHIDGPFGIIENRINKNSTHPDVYLYSKNIMPNLKAFALVAHSELTKMNFEIEKFFLKEAGIEYSLFSNLNDAKKWIDTIA